MGRIKKSLMSIVGKTLRAVVVCQRPGSEPESQLFLVFKDGTSFEIWIDQNQFSMGSQVDYEDLERVVELATQRQGTRVHVIESPLTRLGNSRIEREPEAATNNPLQGIEVSAMTEEYLLFLAIHRRDALLFHLAREADEIEQDLWVDRIGAAFGDLLGRCSFEEMYEGCGADSYWRSVVRPPSVLPAELSSFLGALSIVNPRMYEGVRERAAVEAFTQRFGKQFIESGHRQGREVLAILSQSA